MGTASLTKLKDTGVKLCMVCNDAEHAEHAEGNQRRDLIMSAQFRYWPNMEARKRYAENAHRDVELERLERYDEVLYEKQVADVAKELRMTVADCDAEIARRRARDRDD